MRMRRFLLNGLVVLALFSGGCEAEPEEEFEAQGTGQETALPATAGDVADVAPPAAVGAPGPTPEVVSYAVSLRPLAGSGISGEGSVEREGDRTRVRARLTGTPGGTTHQGHIHQGATCADIGGVVVPLEPITTDAQGMGEMMTTVAPGVNQLMDDNHLIVYHEAGGDPGRPMTCGEVPPLP